MRVVFMGTPAFAVPSLMAVAREHELVAVFTRADRPAGRGRTLRPSAVKEAAARLGVPVFEPATFRESQSVAALSRVEPDLVCVAAYGIILPAEVLAIPRFGCLNVHASLLPRWRGAAPIERAILAGDTVTGVSVMRMETGLDTGPTALAVPLEMGALSAAALREALADAGAAALLETMVALAAGTAEWVVQDDKAATYAQKVTAKDVALDPERPAEELHRRVRASGSSAPSRCVLDGTPVTVLEAEESHLSPGKGQVHLVDGWPVLGTVDGGLSVLTLVPAGRRLMSGADFVRGARPGPHPAWGASA